MDIDLSNVQTVVLTPVSPAIAFAVVVGLTCGAIGALSYCGFDYQQNKRWAPKQKIAGLTAFYLAVSVGLSFFSTTVQLAMNPTISLREVNIQTLNVVAIWCLVTCFSNWRNGLGRTIFGKTVSTEPNQDNESGTSN